MTAHSAIAGVEINAKPSGRQAEILSGRSARFLAGFNGASIDGAWNCWRGEWGARKTSTPASCRISPRHEINPRRRLGRRQDPADLLDRRVEITGPVDRKMIVNALNSGAKVFMADFEDATSPVFANMVEGQANLKDRWAGKIDFTDPTSGKPTRSRTSQPC